MIVQSRKKAEEIILKLLIAILRLEFKVNYDSRKTEKKAAVIILIRSTLISVETGRSLQTCQKNR